MEVWKYIKGYERYYQKSNPGNVKSLRRKKNNGLLNLCPSTRGYPVVVLKVFYKAKTFSVHRLVAEHFLHNTQNKPQINHKNCIKTDNRVENLEWVTDQENKDHATFNRLVASGENHGLTKLTEKEVLEIKKLGNMYSQKEITTMFNVGKSTISNIMNNNTWKYLLQHKQWH